MAIRLEEFSVLAKKANEGAGLAPGGWAHRAALVAKFRCPTGRLRALLSDPEGERWASRIATLAAVGLSAGLNAEAIRGWSVEARREAIAQVARKSWWAFVDDQLRCGPGALHRFTKRPPIAACAPVIRE